MHGKDKIVSNAKNKSGIKFHVEKRTRLSNYML